MAAFLCSSAQGLGCLCAVWSVLCLPGIVRKHLQVRGVLVLVVGLPGRAVSLSWCCSGVGAPVGAAGAVCSARAVGPAAAAGETQAEWGCFPLDLLPTASFQLHGCWRSGSGTAWRNAIPFTSGRLKWLKNVSSLVASQSFHTQNLRHRKIKIHPWMQLFWVQRQDTSISPCQCQVTMALHYTQIKRGTEGELVLLLV